MPLGVAGIKAGNNSAGKPCAITLIERVMGSPTRLLLVACASSCSSILAAGSQ